MGIKRASRKRSNDTHFNANVVEFKPHQKKQQVNIVPKNANQETYLLKLLDSKKHIVFGIGPAGTGKTILSVQVAIKLFKEGAVDHIVVTRPAVSVDEELGFLPGTLEQKMAPWVMPIMTIFKEYWTAKEIASMLEEGIIEIAPLAFMRGRTFRNSFIIFDEAQNCTPNQMKMALTRIGEGSKMVVTGDLAQADRLHENGLIDFVNLLNTKSTQHLDIVNFNHKDIERHQAVREVLRIYGEE
jgi:phosphate starvation-inducible protein PhoH and related proteins